MNQQEFFSKIEQIGIDLVQLGISIGKPRGWEGAHGVYEKNGIWFFYSADGRNHITEEAQNSEDEAFDRMLEEVDFDLLSFTNNYVTRDIAKISKNVICQFIRHTYSLSDRQACDTWNYLKQDMHVLFEFKHYIATGEFVPEKHSYKVQGYSAEKLYKTTYLEVLGSFNYLIYLRNKPKEALLNLEKGLQRRKVFSEACEIDKSTNGEKVRCDNEAE